MFFNKFKLWILAICLFSIPLSLQSTTIDEVTTFGEARLQFLRTLNNAAPNLSKDLRGNDALETEVQRAFITAYGRHLRLTDLAALLALKNSSTGQRLVPLALYIIIECLVVSSISYLEEKRISKSIFSSANNEINKKIDSYIAEIRKIADQIKVQLNNILNVQNSSQNNSIESELIQKLLNQFDYHGIVNSLKIKKDELKKQLTDTILNFCEHCLTKEDMKKLGNLAPAFCKIKNNTGGQELGQFVSGIMPALPGSTTGITNDAKAILVMG